MAEQAHAGAHALQMEYAQEQINEDPSHILEHAEDGAHASPDVVTGDSGNAHDGTRAHYNCVTCRSIGGLRMADVESRHSVHSRQHGRGRVGAVAHGARDPQADRVGVRTEYGAQRVSLYIKTNISCNTTLVILRFSICMIFRKAIW